MARSRGYLFVISVALPVIGVACRTADQDRADRRRLLAEQTCEQAVSEQLASRATARFFSDSEHVYYDSIGGAAVAGVVATPTGQRSFACVLKPESDSTWLLSVARLLK